MISISIVIPVYNIEDYLRRCLDSICNQPCDTGVYEVIIVNDGSPDGSIEIANEYERRYPNVRVVNQQNQGLSAARNTGLNHAKGMYVWFVDGDDKIELGCLTRIIAKLEQEPCDILAFDFLWIKEQSERRNVQLFPTNTSWISGVKHLKINGSGQAWRNIYSYSFLAKFDLRFTKGMLHEDGEYNMRVKVLADKVCYLPEICYYYYSWRKGSLMNSVSIRNVNALLSYSSTALSFCVDMKLNRTAKSVVYSASSGAFKLAMSMAMCIPKSDLELVVRNIKLMRFTYFRVLFGSCVFEHKLLGILCVLCPSVFVKKYGQHVAKNAL